MTLLEQNLPAAPEAPDRPSRRARVLVCAYAVSPARGSEPGLGWNLVSRLARSHDVTVLCAPGCPGGGERSVFRDEITAHAAANGPVPGLTVRHIEPPLLSRLLQRETGLRRRTLYYSGYAAWHRAAYREALRLHAERPFDLAHQLNITGFREPGYLWKLPVPFVWGPVGGASNIPAAFLPLMGWRERLFYRVRNWSNEVQKRTALRCRRAAARASHVWAIGDEDCRLVGERWGRPVERMIESGASPRAGAAVKRRDPSRALRLAWSGLHVGRKALPLLLHAMADAACPPAELTVLGEGPETSRWKALAESLGLAGRVRWTGNLPHAAALSEVAGADAFALTSVQEGTPHVVLEALSLGLPVVCHDACGMGVAVTDACGIKVPMENPDRSSRGFAGALRRLSEEPGLLVRLSAGALRRAEELSWDRKAAAIAAAYDRVLGARGGAVAPPPHARPELTLC